MEYRVTIHPAIEAGNPSIEMGFETEKELSSAVSSMAQLLIFMQDKAKVMDDYSNAFISEQNTDDGWEEIDI